MSHKLRETLGFGRIALALGVLAIVVQTAGADERSDRETVYTITLDRGEDLGQNFGTLFELRSSAGQEPGDARAWLGAGFLGGYNTFDRADRHVLHVFERNTASSTVEPLPRVNDDAGLYLFDRGGRLYARSAADGKDSRVHVFNPTATRWEPAPGIQPDAMGVANGLLAVVDREVRYNDRVILKWPDSEGRLGRLFYAQGRLILWNHFERDDPRTERFLAWRWRPSQSEPLDPADAISWPLPKKGEFPYAMGPLRDDLLVTTNQGGVYRLREDRWEAIRTPDGKSHQIYAALNVGDSLWLGHYPSGEIIEFDGKSLHLLKGFPPVMPGVSSAAREAQALTLFGGDAYVGVWPWAELWRLQDPTPAKVGRWSLIRRMFSHPEATTRTTHPYEQETAARGPVLNQWGQRLTSLVPSGSDLFISTSAKSSKPWSSEFEFLDESTRREYGLVYRLRRPGHLAAPLRWTDGPTRLRIVLDATSIRLEQDGTLVGQTRRADSNERPSDETVRDARIATGQGLYGPAQVKALEVVADPPRNRAPAQTNP